MAAIHCVQCAYDATCNMGHVLALTIIISLQTSLPSAAIGASSVSSLLPIKDRRACVMKITASDLARQKNHY